MENDIHKDLPSELKQVWLDRKREFLLQVRQEWVNQALSEEEVRLLTGALFDIDVSCAILIKTLREMIVPATLNHDQDLLLKGLVRYETWLGEVKERLDSTMQLLDSFSDYIGEQLGD